MCFRYMTLLEEGLDEEGESDDKKNPDLVSVSKLGSFEPLPHSCISMALSSITKLNIKDKVQQQH